MATIDDDRYIDLGLLDAAFIVPFDNTRALRRAARRNAIKDASLGLDSDYLSNVRVDTRPDSNYADVYNKVYDKRRQRYEQNNFTNAQKRQLISDLKRGGNAAQDAFGQYVSRGMDDFARRYVAPGLAATFAAPFAISGAATLGANPAVLSALGRVARRAGKMIFDPLHAETAAESLIGTGLDVGTTAMTARDLFNRNFSPNKTRYSSVNNYLASGLPKDVLDLTGVLGPAAYYGRQVPAAINEAKRIGDSAKFAYVRNKSFKNRKQIPINLNSLSPYTKATDFSYGLNDRELYETRNAIRDDNIVDSSGNIDKKAFRELLQELSKKYTALNPFDTKYGSSNGVTTLYDHLLDVAKSAQELPLAKGVTRQDAVRAALIHDIGKMDLRDPSDVLHATRSGQLIKDNPNLLEEFNSPDIINAVSYHMPMTNNMPLTLQTNPELSRFTKSNLGQMLAAADVGRGRSMEILDQEIPYLLTYPKETPAQLYSPKDVNDEYRFALSWARKYGYPADKKTWGSPGSDKFYNTLEQTLDRHNTFFRGVRDENEKALTSIADNPLDAPGGRAGLYGQINNHGVRNQFRQGLYLRMNPANGDDAIYVTANPTIAKDIVGDSGQVATIVRKSDPFQNGKETVPEYINRRELDLIDLNSSLMSNFNQYELPYYLQTGKWLRQEKIKPESKVDLSRQLMNPTNIKENTANELNRLGINLDVNNLSAKDLNEINEFVPLDFEISRDIVKNTFLDMCKYFNLGPEFYSKFFNPETGNLVSFGNFNINRFDKIIKDSSGYKYYIKGQKEPLSKKQFMNYVFDNLEKPMIGKLGLESEHISSSFKPTKSNITKLFLNKLYRNNAKRKLTRSGIILDRTSAKAMYNYMKEHGYKLRTEMPNFGNNLMIVGNERWGLSPQSRNYEGYKLGISPQAYFPGQKSRQLFEVKDYVDISKLENSDKRWLREDLYPISRKTNAFGGYIKL